jgi:hypothetical protein
MPVRADFRVGDLPHEQQYDSAMASMTSSPLRLGSLPKKSMAQLVSRAKAMGVAPENFAAQLIEDGLALRREAESTPMAELMAPVRKATGAVNEKEIVRLVEKARNHHYRPQPRRGKRR